MPKSLGRRTNRIMVRRRRRPQNSALTRMVRPPPGTTKIVVPYLRTYEVNTGENNVAFDINPTTLLSGSEYQGLSNIYSYLRVKRVTFIVECPSASTNTTASFAVSLQRVAALTGNQSNPSNYAGVLAMFPSNSKRIWQQHRLQWLPTKPQDHNFQQLTDNTALGCLYVSTFSLENGSTIMIRARATFEFYGQRVASAPTKHMQVLSGEKENECEIGDDIEGFCEL